MNGKLEHAWAQAGDKCHDLMELLRSQGIHLRLSSYIANLKSFLRHESN